VLQFTYVVFAESAVKYQPIDQLYSAMTSSATEGHACKSRKMRAVGDDLNGAN